MPISPGRAGSGRGEDVSPAKLGQQLKEAGVQDRTPMAARLAGREPGECPSGVAGHWCLRGLRGRPSIRCLIHVALRAELQGSHRWCRDDAPNALWFLQRAAPHVE